MADSISKGIYRDRSGVFIRVHVNGQPREFRKDAHGTRYRDYTPAQLRDERKRVEARERLKGEAARTARGTLAGDIAIYVQMLSGRTKADAENLLAHWAVTFGDRPRHSLTEIELRQAAAQWVHHGKPLAASTFNHRRQALISLYVALDGPTAKNPARAIPKQKEVLGAPRAISYDQIRAVFVAMPETQSRARLKVMAYTGLPQMQIQKLTPEDWQGQRLRVTPRRKGAGATGRWIPLAPEAVEALQEFARLKCWGDFSRSSLCKAWKAYGPPGTNPYSLRHSWITELYRRSNGDVLALQQLALHARLEQTQRYTAAALHDRMTALVLPRTFPTTGRGKSSISFQNGVVREARKRAKKTAAERRKQAKSARK